MIEQIIILAVGVVLSLVGGLISKALTRVSESVQGLRSEVTTLNCTVAGIEKKLNLIELNYVSHKEHDEIKQAFWDLHDEHIKRSPTRCKK